MINNNSIVSEYLSSTDSLYSPANMEDSVDMFDPDTAMYEESVFISANSAGKDLSNSSIFFVNGKNSSDSDDEISRLFLNFSKSEDY